MANNNTNNMASTKWANRTKAATQAVPLSKPAAKADRGTRVQAVLESFTPTSYSTGSFGIKLKYAVDGMQRAVYENIVLRKLTSNGTFEATKYGESSLKRRLQAFGLTADEVNAFPIPVTPKDESEAYQSLSGSRVVLYLTDREYMGKTYQDVKSAWPADNE